MNFMNVGTAQEQRWRQVLYIMGQRHLGLIRVKATLFCVEKNGLRSYPAFYLAKCLDRRRLEAVSKLLGPAPGGTKWQFWMTPRGSLALPGKTVDGVLTENVRPRSPLNALRDGDVELVMQAAQAQVER